MNASRVSESTVQSPPAFAIEDEVLAWVWLVRTCMLVMALISSYTTTDGVVYTDTHFVKEIGGIIVCGEILIFGNFGVWGTCESLKGKVKDLRILFEFV